VSEPARTIAVVLDTTAVTAWVRGSVAVGELLAEINDEHGAALIPLACLVEAAHKTALLHQAQLRLLVDHPATFLIADDPDEWPALAAMRNLVVRPDLAAAAWLSLANDVFVMTRDPRWYSSVNGGRSVLEFDE
jgi:hypothetical protein